MAFQPTGNAAIEAALKELDGEIRALQVRYEQYFLGFERVEPAKERDALRRSLMALKRENPRNTGLKFRLNSLWNKYLSYERMWQRTVTEIEEGRYRRDVFKAKMRGRAATTVPGDAADKLREAIRQEESGVSEPGRTDPGASRSEPKRPAPRGDDGLPDAKLRQLYQAYVTAKKRCKEDTSKISVEALERSLRKQIPQIKAKHKASAVDFKVVIKGGKAMLKAVPRNE